MIWRVPERMETKLTPTAAIVRVEYALRLKMRKYKLVTDEKWTTENMNDEKNQT